MIVLHSDPKPLPPPLQARNVMLKRSGDSRGFIAKVWICVGFCVGGVIPMCPHSNAHAHIIISVHTFT